MKLFKLLGCIIAFAMFFPMFISADKDPIPVGGTWPPKTRSIDQGVPFSAVFDNSSKNLTLYVNGNVGNISVTVEDNNGNAVYSQSLQGNYGTVLTISMNGEPAGTYVISVTDGTNYVSGQFQV